MRFVVMPVMALALGTALAIPPAEAKGCIKGAVVGGGVGVVGMVAPCLGTMVWRRFPLKPRHNCRYVFA